MRREHPENVVAEGREGDSAAVWHRVRTRAHAGRDRPGVRRHSGANPPDRGEGSPAVAFAGTSQAFAGLAGRAVIAGSLPTQRRVLAPGLFCAREQGAGTARQRPTPCTERVWQSRCVRALEWRFRWNWAVWKLSSRALTPKVKAPLWKSAHPIQYRAVLPHRGLTAVWTGAADCRSPCGLRSHRTGSSALLTPCRLHSGNLQDDFGVVVGVVAENRYPSPSLPFQ